MDTYADEAFAVVGLWQVGVEIHMVRTQLGQAFAAKQKVRQPLHLPDRIDAVKDAFLYVRPRRRHAVDRPADPIVCKADVDVAAGMARDDVGLGAAGDAAGAGALAGPAGGGGGFAALKERLVAELQLSADQQTRLDAIAAELRPKFVALRDLPEEERGAARDKVSAEMRAKITAMLSPARKTKYEAMQAQAGQGGARTAPAAAASGPQDATKPIAAGGRPELGSDQKDPQKVASAAPRGPVSAPVSAAPAAAASAAPAASVAAAAPVAPAPSDAGPGPGGGGGNAASEFRNRLDAVVYFHGLSREVTRRVVDKEVRLLEVMLEDKQVDGTSIKVETLNGTVMLSGFAKSSDEKYSAQRIAQGVQGVKMVKNEITVRP